MTFTLYRPEESRTKDFRTLVDLPDVQSGDPLVFHATLPGYAPTLLFDAPPLARRLGVARVLIKDESERLGLPAFKMLGASWATARAIQREWLPDLHELTLESLQAALAESADSTTRRRLAAATDGNHGRGVARMAALLGLDCSIFVPAGTADSRINDIASEGAEVTVVDGSYDDAIVRSAREADDHTLIISDTSWPGYRATPTDVIVGYSTMFREIDELLAARGEQQPDVVLFQSGVGSFAAAGLRHYRAPGRAEHPFTAIVEPTRADCLMRSARAGEVTEAPAPHPSTMAGLNCGLPSLLAWPVVESASDAYVSIDDSWAHDAMKVLASIGIVAGESGAAALGALLAITSSTEDPSRLGLSPDATVLIVNTEFATDPVNYANRVGEHPSAVFEAAAARRAISGTVEL